MAEHPKIQLDADGSLRLNFGEYGQQVEVAAFSADGGRMLTVRAVGTAEVWDTRSGARVGVIEPDSPLRGSPDAAPYAGPFAVFIESAALDHDGSFALLGLNDGTAGVFRVADGVRLAVLHPPAEPPATRWSVLRAVAFSPDGSLALVGFPGRSVGVWDARGEQLVALLRSRHGVKLVGTPFVRDTLVSSVAASADNRSVFAGCVDSSALVWDLRSEQVVFEAIEHAEDALAVFDNAAGFGWATTGGHVWSSRAGEDVRKTIASGEHWSEVCFAGDRLLARSHSGAVSCWQLAGQGHVLLQPDAASHAMWSDQAQTLAFRQPDELLYPEGGRRLAFSSPRAHVRIEREAQIVTACFAPDGNVAVSGWSDEVELWSASDGSLVRSFGVSGGVGAFAFSPDGSRLAIGEIGRGGGMYTRQLYVFDTATGRCLQRHGEHDWQISQVAFSPDGRRVASLGDDIVVWAFQPVGWLRKHRLASIEVERASAAMRYLPDGRLVVVDRGRVRVFVDDVQIRALPAPIAFRSRWCVSDDGRTLAVAVDQGIVRIDLEGGKLLGTWRAPMPRFDQLPPPALAQEIDARAGVALWRTERGPFLHQSDGPRGWVEPIQLSASGECVIPTRAGAAVLAVEPQVSLRAVVPFTGKLRASRVIGGEVLLVNEAGQLFRAQLPG